MRLEGVTSFALVGSGLVAIAFGLARYAFGLFVPSIRADLGLAPDTIGIVISLAFVGFVLASIGAPALTDRLGARNAAVTAATLAATGLALVAAAGTAVTLGTGVLICGLSTGMMMPSLTAGMHAAVSPAVHGRVTALMNASTTIGVMVCAPAAMLLGDDWRLTYASFAAVAAIGVAAAWLRIPSASRAQGHAGGPTPPMSRRQILSLGRLLAFGFGAGIAGAAFWIFAPDLVTERGGLAGVPTACLWLAVGIAGIAGAWISDLADRFGTPMANALALAGIAAGTAMLAALPGNAASALAAAAVFGAAFMSLAGLYLVTAVRLLPNRPALAGMAPFLAITIGQAAGSPLVGRVIDSTGYAAAFQLFAALALVLAATSVCFPDPATAPAEEPAVPEEHLASAEAAVEPEPAEPGPTEAPAPIARSMALEAEAVAEA